VQGVKFITENTQFKYKPLVNEEQNN